MGKTLSNVDKGTRQDLIIRLISERSLGTQQDVVAALSDVGVEVAQATVSRDLAELGVLKVGNRYLALPHEPGSAVLEAVPGFVLGGLALAEVQVQGVRLGALLLEPLQTHRGVEPPGVGEHDLLSF